MTIQAEQSRLDTGGDHVSEPSQPSQANVGIVERVMSVSSGGWLLLKGVRHGGLTGLTTAGLGAMFVKRGVSGHCPMYEKLGVNTNGHLHAIQQDPHEHGIHVVQTYTINKSSEELFAFWRNFENLPTFMTHLQEVKTLDDKKSHWKAKAPAGFSVEWDAEILEEEPGRLISWRSLEGADVNNSGSVRFIDAQDRGTQVRVALDYIPPLGRLGATLARVFGEEPNRQIKEDLRHFKQLMESGEIPTNRGPRGKCQNTDHQRRSDL